MNLPEPVNYFITQNAEMNQLIELSIKFSKMREPILIMGETGTGKDLLAKMCHTNSRRYPFLAINCAALPDDVVESELYGHAAGAYPNAIEEKKGFFEQADGGSVLLDEIGEMSARMQAKLLRFINDGTFRRVGEDAQKSVDVRIICATQKNLQQLTEQAIFRQDLYFRLNVLPLSILPLRERKEDIVLLAEHFIACYTEQKTVLRPKLSSSAKEKLRAYSWPGNVRQLKNSIHLAIAKSDGMSIEDKNIFLPDTLSEKGLNTQLDALESYTTLDEMTRQFEKNVLEKFYQRYPSSRKLAARLGLSHTAIANKLREYGIKKKQINSDDTAN